MAVILSSARMRVGNCDQENLRHLTSTNPASSLEGRKVAKSSLYRIGSFLYE